MIFPITNLVQLNRMCINDRTDRLVVCSYKQTVSYNMKVSRVTCDSPQGLLVHIEFRALR